MKVLRAMHRHAKTLSGTLATPAELESATSDVTDQCSNLLNYGAIYKVLETPLRTSRYDVDI